MNQAEPIQSVPESYVVRIYRRSPNSPGRVAGTVEIVGAGGERSFRTLRELQRILLGVRQQPSGGRATSDEKPA